MKIYVGNREIQEQDFKKTADIKVLDFLADDSECTNIVFDNILSKYPISELGPNIQLAIKKLRIGGLLLINDIDFDILSYLYRKSPNIVELNNSMANFGGFKSFLTNDLISDIMKNYPELKIIANNFNGIEFRLEFTRQ
jgi:hypothetical protein